jgi:uncharacterized protein (DUF934 family)
VVRGQVLHADQSAAALHLLRKRFGNRSAIKGITAVLRDQLE